MITQCLCGTKSDKKFVPGDLQGLLGNEKYRRGNPEYQSAEVTFYFHATPILTADFDENGQVDGADLAGWMPNFGPTGEMAKRDGDADDTGCGWEGLPRLATPIREWLVQVPVVSSSVPEPAGFSGLYLVSAVPASLLSAEERARQMGFDHD